MLTMMPLTDERLIISCPVSLPSSGECRSISTDSGRVDRDGRSDKQVRRVFMVDLEVDTPRHEVAIYRLVGLRRQPCNAGEGERERTVKDRLRLEAFMLSAVSNSTMYRLGMNSALPPIVSLNARKGVDVLT